MLSTEKVIQLRKDNPDLSDSAFLLLVLIIFRTSGTKLKDSKGRFIYMTGENDPEKVFGWTHAKYYRFKNELRSKGYITVGNRGGYGKGSKVYLNCFDFSTVAFSICIGTDTTNCIENDTTNCIKTDTTNCIETDTNSKERNNKRNNKREENKNKKGTPPIAAAPSAHTPLSSNPFRELLTDGKPRPDDAVKILKVLSYLCDSFPTKPDKFPNPKGTAQSWYKSLGKYDERDLMKAIEDYKAKKPFFPSISEIKTLADYHKNLRLIDERN